MPRDLAIAAATLAALDRQYGAAIAAIFAPHNKRFMGMRNVVVVACGGSVVNWSLLRSWKDQLGLGELRVE